MVGLKCSVSRYEVADGKDVLTPLRNSSTVDTGGSTGQGVPMRAGAMISAMRSTSAARQEPSLSRPRSAAASSVCSMNASPLLTRGIANMRLTHTARFTTASRTVGTRAIAAMRSNKARPSRSRPRVSRTSAAVDITTSSARMSGHMRAVDGDGERDGVGPHRE
jgi:hypothetical protein